MKNTEKLNLKWSGENKFLKKITCTPQTLDCQHTGRDPDNSWEKDKIHDPDNNREKDKIHDLDNSWEKDKIYDPDNSWPARSLMALIDLLILLSLSF